MKLNKKILLPIVGLAILLLIILGAYLILKSRGNKTTPEPSKKPAITAPVNTVDLTDRPYVTLMPRNDGHEIELAINSLPLKASEVEYELEYQAGTLLQGAFGSIDLESTGLPAIKDILLGSCSAGGACSYHEDVKGGTLTLKFRAAPNYALKNEWRFIPTQEAEGLFSSRDSKFQLDAGKALNKSAYVIVMQTSGLPDKTPGEVISGPYGLFVSNGLPQDSQADLSLRLTEDVETATIYGWDGSAWVDYQAKVADKTATAQVGLYELYIASK